jgi:hypothetical protein
MAAGHPILSKLTCNLTNRYSDTCKTEGVMRVHGKSGIAYVISASPYHPENSTIKIKPYAPKWEQTVLELVREITVWSIPVGGDTNDSITAPPCSVRHDVPAVVFSTGGYNQNFYHVLTDHCLAPPQYKYHAPREHTSQQHSLQPAPPSHENYHLSPPGA